MGLKSGSKSGKGVKQSSSKLGTNKIQSSGKQGKSDEPDIDTSVMRPSIEISVSGVPQLVQAYQAATEELKSILARECDIIYECRVCRNLFRSLANMMAHKRVYCKTSYSFTKHCLNRNRMVEDYTVVIEPEPAPTKSPDKQSWITSDAVPDLHENDSVESNIVKTAPRISSNTNTKRGLREIVDRLTRNSYINSSEKLECERTSAAQLYDNINESILARKNDRMEHSFHLEDMETTKVGKFQTKLPSSAIGIEKEDLMKAQVSELQIMTSQSEAILGPDGQTISLDRHSPSSFLKSTSEKNENQAEAKSCKDEHVCPDCNIKFSTRKTLNHHMKSLHVMFRLCYPCPCCKSTFVNPWSVYRHLYKVHRKTAAQVRRMRPQIQKKAFRKEFHNDTPVVEGNAKSDAMKELQRLDQENQAWMDNFEDDLELQRCGGCGRRFERRAALNSHSQICQKRIAARNNLKVVRNVPSTSNSDNLSKLVISDGQALSVDVKKKANDASKVIEFIPDVTKNFIMARTRQGSNWVEQKKEVREKKIEIQIRKDYCKMSSSSSVIALSNDTQSEPSSRPPSTIVEDEICYVNEKDWDSSVDEMDEVKKDESDSEDPESPNIQQSGIFVDEDSEKEEVYTRSSSENGECEISMMNFEDENIKELHSDKDTDSVGEIAENSRKRKVSNDDHLRQINHVKRTRQNLKFDYQMSSEIPEISFSSKAKKLEQFHPVMEARMKKLINLRRLQCLPCQKKFIKLTNLRRHVAVHIGWCRYQCVLCPFKCFSKSDCVDHVCKVHLKGSQRNKAAAMVEYIEEQESEPINNTFVVEELRDDTDQMSQSDEGNENLSIEVNSLNLEDIKNIVGVINYDNEPKVPENTHTTDSESSGHLSLNVSDNSEIIQEDMCIDDSDIKGESLLANNSVKISDEASKNTETNLEGKECPQIIFSSPASDLLEDSGNLPLDPVDLHENYVNMSENLLDLPENSINSSERAVNLSDNSINSPEKTINLSENSINSPEEVVNLSENSVNISEIPADLLKDPVKLPENVVDLPIDPVEVSQSTVDLPKNPINLPEESKGSTGEMENVLESLMDPTNQLQGKLLDNSGMMEQVKDEIVRPSEQNSNSQELKQYVKSDKIHSDTGLKESIESTAKSCIDFSSIKSELQSISPYLIYDEQRSESSEPMSDEPSDKSGAEVNDFEEKYPDPPGSSNQTSDEHICLKQDVKTINVNLKMEKEFTDTKENSEDVSNENFDLKDETFSDENESDGFEGTELSEVPTKEEDGENALRKMVMEVIFGSGINSDHEANQNLYSVSMNGDDYDCVSLDGRISRASSPSNPDIVCDTSDNLSDTFPKITKAKLGIERSVTFESERRERPVRNRVKVAKEDFIYDFTDSFTKKEDSSKVVKKKQTDMGKESAKNETSTLNSQKTIPKLMLVRTDSSETVANSHLTGPVKGSWSSIYSQNPDYVNSKTCVASSSQLYSAKKVPRTHDVKP